jgi:glycosyltransferase involved in cell wall biosynthesis
MGIGGLERIVAALMEGADRSIFSSGVYCLEGGGELMTEMLDKGHAAKALGKGAGVNLLLPWRLAKHLRADGVDVVHCHNFGAFAYGAVAGRLARVRGVLYTAHGPEFPSLRRQAVLERLPLADRVVAVSDYIRRSAIERAGIDPGRVTTIRNGVDIRRFAPSTTDAAMKKRLEIGVGESDALIGVVARLSAEKDHATLIAAFARVAAGRPKSRLIVVGDGELMGELKGQTGRLGLDGSVLFLGKRTDVTDLLRMFDVFALSSKEEGLGITILEAMASGVPVVATCAGGIPEIVEHGVTGVLVPPGDEVVLGDAIEWVLSHPEAVAAMAAAARRRVEEQFSLDRMVAAYERLYALSVRPWERDRSDG